MDIGTGLALFGTAKLAEKLLGPTTEYLGQGIRDWTEVAVKNVSRIFAVALKKAGAKLDTEGSVPPKVLKGIIQEGAFCDDPLSAEYFGGVLASSRSNIPRDDRAAALIALLSRLSTYQIRGHYIFYHLIKRLYDGSGLTIKSLLAASSLRIRSSGKSQNDHMKDGKTGTLVSFLSNEAFADSMGFSEKERSQFQSLIHHVVEGLSRESLIGPYHRFGTADGDVVSANNPEGIVVQPSVLGVELFLWAYGKPEVAVTEFLDPRQSFETSTEIKIEGGRIARS